MEYQKCVLLVYSWLKEHGLRKTCLALAEEYGSSVASETPLALTLNDLLQSVSALLQVYTNSSLSKLLTTLKDVPPDPNLKTKPGKTKPVAKKPHKRKASIIHDTETDTTPIFKTDFPVAVVNDPCISSSSSSLSNIQSVPELTEKNSIQKTAPVMKEKIVPKEKRLPLLPADVWACPEMEETLTKVYERTMLSVDVGKVVDVPFLPEVVAALSDRKNEEENHDVDIESIEVTYIENIEKKKKKKKKNIAACLRNIENPITPLEVVGSDETSYIVKKKKKKNVEEIQVVSEFTPLVPVADSSTSETDDREKKIEGTALVVPQMEAIVEVNELPEEVKKKKKKKKSIGGAQDTAVNEPATLDIVANEPTAPETEIHTDAVVLETVFASETRPVRKRKKKIPVEHNSTCLTTEYLLTATPSKENVSADDILALSTLGQSLKKKKKKSKNIEH